MYAASQVSYLLKSEIRALKVRNNYIVRDGIHIEKKLMYKFRYTENK